MENIYICKLFRALDADGKNVRSVFEKKDNELIWNIDDDAFKHGVTSYQLQYSMSRVTRSFSDGDEFFPNVTGNDWKQPIRKAQANLYIAADLIPYLDNRMQCFHGSYGQVNSDCSITVTELVDFEELPQWFQQYIEAGHIHGMKKITVEVTDLAPKEGLSFGIGFLPGTFFKEPLPIPVLFSHILSWACGVFALIGPT